MTLRHPSLYVLAAAIIGGCVFELADVVQPGSGPDGGANGSDGGSAVGGSGAGNSNSGGATGSYEIAITVNHGENISTALEDVPVLVVLNPDRIDYDLTGDDGDDIRFVAADGTTPLAHEIERWQPGGTSLLWVKLPSLLDDGQQFYLRFGDAAAPGQPDPTDVWNNYLGVYHLAGDLTAEVIDSSSKGHHGTPTNVESDASGMIGHAATFDGSTSRVDFGYVPDFDVPSNGQRSLELWFRRNTTAEDTMAFFRVRNNCCTGYRLLVLGDQWANIRHDVASGSCCGGNQALKMDTSPFAIPDGGTLNIEWHTATVVMDRQAGYTFVYLDAALEATEPIVDGGDFAGSNAAMGVSVSDTYFLNGSLDELRVSHRAFSATWVAIQRSSQKDELLEFGTAVRH